MIALINKPDYGSYSHSNQQDSYSCHHPITPTLTTSGPASSLPIETVRKYYYYYLKSKVSSPTTSYS